MICDVNEDLNPTFTGLHFLRVGELLILPHGWTANEIRGFTDLQTYLRLEKTER